MPTSRLRQLIGHDLNHGSRIHLSRVQVVVSHGEHHNGARHETAEVHVRGIRIRHLREEAEDEDDDAVPDAKGVQQDAPDAGDVEGAPDELVGLPRRPSHLARVADRPPDAVPEKEGLGEDVRGVEAADAEGDDVVEGGRGADVYQADGAGDGGHDQDGVQRDRGACLDLRGRFSSILLVGDRAGGED